MTPIEKVKLAYKVAERLSLLPLLDEEVEAVLFSLDLIRDEDIKN
jgi:hypothetical protein